MERANHVKHCLNHLFPEGVVECGSHLHGSALGKDGEDGAQLFHCTNPQHASFSHGTGRLVSVGDLIATTKDKHAVVADVDEVDQEATKQGLLILLKEARILLQELIHDLRQEVQRILLILSVSIGAARHQDDLPQSLRLNQELEESLIFAELGEDLAGIEGHVHIVAILRG